MPSLNEFSYWQRQQPAQPVADCFFVTLPDYAKANNHQADDRKAEGEHHAVLKYIVGQVAKVPRRTQPTENGEDSARKHGPHDNHHEVDAQIDEFV